MNFFDEIRNKFLFLTFLTDREIDDLMTIVRSVAAGTAIRPDEILQYIDAESSTQMVFC